ncbi:MAG: peptidase U32 family protein, partial [Nitrospinota bacterium]
MPSLATHVPNLRRLEACDWSAYDTLYLGDPSCPLHPGNFGRHGDELAAGVEMVKGWGKRAIVSLYAVPRNEDLPWLRALLEDAMERRLPLDGVEVHNLGLLVMLRELRNPWPVTIGVCGNLYTVATAQLLSEYGVVAGFPNPEVGLAEVEELAREGGLELVLQVHGKIPLGFSDRCFVVDYQKQVGTCEEVCFADHWLVRDGWTLKNIGRVVLSGKELCMIEHLPALLKAGHRQFYIWTFAESSDYVAALGAVYREALEEAAADGAHYRVRPEWEETIRRFAPVGLCNG